MTLSEEAKKAFDEKRWADGINAALKTDLSDAVVLAWLGYCRRWGKGVPVDYARAFSWFEKSAKKGYAYSQNELGLCYEHGRGVERNLEEAFKWYLKAAENGERDGQFNVADMYEYGKGTEKNPAAAFKWYKVSAENNNASAQNRLGLCYEYGKGTEKNLSKAFYWFKKAAENGKVEAQNNLGVFYEHGHGTEVDFAAAFKWYLASAKKGYASAQCNLALAYEFGRGVEVNLEEALKWYKASAENGWARSAYRLGLCHEHGKGTEENIAEAFKCYLKAAEKGNLDGQFSVADMYEFGKGTEKNPAAAFKWYKASAENNHANGQNRLGLCYEYGRGVKRNLGEAFRWYLKAAENGNVSGQFNVADMYEHGKGVDQDFANALDWYKKAAGKGHKRAMYKLGRLYENGTGTRKDLVEAKKWYRKARKAGEEDAEGALEELEEKMKPLPGTKVTQSPDGAAPASIDDIMHELDSLIGLERVKDEVRRLADFAKLQKLKDEKGLKTTTATNHIVFMGNPGTGKTVVARIVAKVFNALGVLKTDKLVETGKDGLCSSYKNETATKTNAVVDSALDGVLFIDEAYSLVEGGGEAVDALIRRMEDDRDRLVVIVAGYPEKMKEFLKMNPGLRSRFTRYIDFPDYSADELTAIFESAAKDADCTFGDDVIGAVREIMELERSKRLETFGNARYVRTFLEKAMENQAVRVGRQKDPQEKDVQRIEVADLPMKSVLGGEAENVEDILRELDGLVGLKPVKRDIRKLADFVQIQKRRKEAGLPTVGGASYHCVFTGSPGTGKTTVARYMARIYQALGITRTNHLEEASRSELVAEYVGQTAPKTNKVIDEALNGVLFIDEAYSLVEEGGRYNFGKEAIDTLVKRMEDDRDRLVVIVAGYTDEMRKFIGMNPGLKSRFTRYINFPDYSADELVEIFERMAKNEKYSLGKGVHDAVHKIMGRLVAKKTKSFGNAREVRDFYQYVMERQSSRLAKEREPTKEQLSTILLEDVCDVPAAGSEQAGGTQADAAHSEDAAHRKMEDGGVVVAVDYSPCINLAMALNNVQLVFRVQIHNGTGSPLLGCELSVTSPDGTFDDWSAETGDLPSGGDANIGKLSMKLNAGLLEKVSCARSGSMCLTLRAGGKTVFSQSCDVSIVPANYLHSVMLAPALLAAHVLPTSAVVRQVQSDAMRILDAKTGIASIAGYANGEGSVGQVCEAVFEAVRNLGVCYATTPASLGLPGQKVRTPAEITRYKLGTCLDLTLLFAAIFEECGLNAVIVLVSGHAFLGVFRSDRHFAHAVMPDLEVLKKVCKDGKMIFIEATRACGATNTFHAAFQSAASKLMTLAEGEFHCAIDVGMARRDGILPLPIDDMDGPSAVSTAASPASAAACGGEGGTLTEARIAPISKPCMVKFYDERMSVRTWKDVFEAILRKMNERDPAKFEALPCDPQFGRYFMRIEPGKRTPHDYFKIKLGTSSDVRVKAITGRAYLWRTDYYFRKLMDHLGVDVGRIEVI